MVEVEGNLLTPDHYISRREGPWATAGEQTQLEIEPQTGSASIVYNITLQEGDNIELGNRIHAATLGARIDVAGSGEEPTYSEKDARYLQGLPKYSSGHIHWAAFGTVTVDFHGMKNFEPITGPPSRAGTLALLDKDVLEIILSTQQAEQGWIDNLRMFRRVNSIWNYVARSIYPDLTDYIPEEQQIPEVKESWRSAFHRERQRARDRMCGLRDPTGPSDKPRVRYILGIIQTYPATLNIQAETMWALQWRLAHINLRDRHEMVHEGGLYATTLYSALSRHVLRPGPYAARDIENQIREHTTITPRSTRVHRLGTLILASLDEFYHHRLASRIILVESLRVLTFGRTPRQKLGQDHILTKQVASLLLMHLRGMECEHLARLGASMTKILTTFVQTHLISSGQHWMKRKAFEAWTEVKEPLTALLYGITAELLRIQSGHATLQQGNMLTAMADSVGDNMQQNGMTIHGFGILSKLNAERDISPLDGAILSVLRATWNMNSLTPQLWTQGHRHRRAMHIAGTTFDSEEALQSIQLTAEVMKEHFPQLSRLQLTSPLPRSRTEEQAGLMAEHASFLQVGSIWILEMAIDSMSNWSLLNKLTTELILVTMVLRKDDPITSSNCMGTLYLPLVNSAEEICGKIRGLEGVETIISLLPRQFPEEV